MHGRHIDFGSHGDVRPPLAVSAAIETRDFPVQAMQARMRLPRVRFAGLRFGNLNTPEDLRLAGYGDG